MEELIEKLKELDRVIDVTRYEGWNINLTKEEAQFLLNSLQSKGKTKSAEEFLRNKSYPSGVSDADWEDFKHREKGVLFVPFVIEAMEEYTQSHANKDGWVSCKDRLPEAEKGVG